MTQVEFNLLPFLLTRAQVVACGISGKVIDSLAVPLEDWMTVVPFGKIGAVRIGGGRKKLYRKSDLVKMIGMKI